ncbi:hypothetical protein C9993_12455, partial [Marinobacter sp. Z-F4-2]
HGIELPLFRHIAACPLWQPFMLSSRYEYAASLKKGTKLAKSASDVTLDTLSFAHNYDFSIGPESEDEVRVCLGSLLNLVAPARSGSTLPTLWSHATLKEHLLENAEVVETLKRIWGDEKPTKLPSFIRDHLVRTSNAEIEGVVRKKLGISG